MKAIAALLLVSAACGGDDIALYPVNPGGGGPTSGTSRADANEGDGDSGVTISGRVCVITDARNPTTGCADTGFAGLTVTIGTRTAMTMADGQFTIRVLSGTDNVWHVTGTGITPSAMTFTSSNTIPALTAQTFTEMVAANPTAAVPGGSGSIITRLTGNGAASAATATTEPPTAGAVLYDGLDNVNWSATATGVRSVIWAPGISPTNTATMTVTTAAQATTLMNIPVFANTITWLTANVP